MGSNPSKNFLVCSRNHRVELIGRLKRLFEAGF